jgi:hypothetical protein
MIRLIDRICVVRTARTDKVHPIEVTVIPAQAGILWNGAVIIAQNCGYLVLARVPRVSIYMRVPAQSYKTQPEAETKTSLAGGERGRGELAN